MTTGESMIVVITSINPPTDAIRAWSQLLPTMVVADLKTPVHAYTGSPVELLAVGSPSRLSAPPENHYARKNLGYLEAMARGVDAILDTDDDTFPEAGLVPARISVDASHGRGASAATCNTSDFVNIFCLRTGDRYLWPRGFPLDALHDEPSESAGVNADANVGVVQFLIDGDTDVDAVQRLVFGAREVAFPRTGRLQVVASGKFCPFNSQLTLVRRVAFPLLYLPSTVAFRFTDILRSIVAKRVLDRMGIAMAFADPIGFQVRNPHDYMTDFAGEFTCQTQTAAAWGILNDLPVGDAVGLLRESYERLATAGIVGEAEASRLADWCDSLPA